VGRYGDPQAKRDVGLLIRLARATRRGYLHKASLIDFLHVALRRLAIVGVMPRGRERPRIAHSAPSKRESGLSIRKDEE
jgi:hypothetical protein